MVTHSPKSGLLVSTFISCLQDSRAIVGSRSAGLSKLSLVQLGFPGLSSALCIFFFWHQSWRRHASFLVKVQRERHRLKHTTAFKASAQSWHTWCLTHSTGRSRSVTKSIVKCMGKHTLPTAGMTRIEKEKLIISNCDLPSQWWLAQKIVIFHRSGGLLFLPVFLYHALGWNSGPFS